ncbi:MAG TPA: MFS transporter [Vineibacter sp.]|nr:MFS transporter [Vineibacter sp.]
MSTDDGATSGKAPYGAAVYLAVVQFFFGCTWIVYVIFLPAMAETAGIGKAAVVWILMLDQVVFAAMDLAMGVWADRVVGALRRLGPLILAISTLSCLAFLLLPHAVRLEKDGPLGAPVVAGALILLWTATSSALRAPPWVLLSKYAATPRMPWLSALTLSGLAIGGAISPYLGVRLRDLDPRLPFAISALTLLATTAGLIWVERYLARGRNATPTASGLRPASTTGAVDPVLAAFFFGCAVLAFGFQIHFFLNSAGQYLRFAKPADLEYLMPVFWIGFNLLMFPGAALANRFGVLPVMAMSAMLGLAGMVLAATAGNLSMLLVGHFLAGGGWGGAMMAAFAGSMAFGHKGREGLMIGILSTLFALAAFSRMTMVAVEVNKAADAKAMLPWLPPGLWLLGATALLPAALIWSRRTPHPR